MINEKIEAEDYLWGNHINKENLYRTCSILAKYYKEKGLEPIEIRQAIFDWGKRYDIFITHNLNALITSIMNDPLPLAKKTPVIISRGDICEITSRFDHPKTRLTALSMLCYAKAYGGTHREFCISCVSLGAWIGISRSHLKRRYVQELLDYDYLSETEKPKNNYTWNNPQLTKYKLNPPFYEGEDYRLEDNDIHLFYSRIFL